MAVAPGGFFGEYYSHYLNLSDSRNWNTKNYDYAVIKNKGELSEEGKNESPGSLQGTGLTVATNKNGYLATTSGEFIPDLKNPIYQVRDRNGNVNNDYYVDQETGNIYFRPQNNGTSISLPNAVATAGGPGTFTLPPAFAPMLQVGGFVSINGITVQLATVAGSTATFNPPSLTVTAGTQIDLVPVNTITPQYFGSAIELERAPNPEDFGTRINNINNSAADNSAWQDINYTFTAPAGNAYSELEINGVKVAVNGLNTATIQSIPQFMLDNTTPVPAANTPQAPLYRYTNSFSTDATEFTSVEPPTKWKGIGVANGWANNSGGAQTLPGGTPSPTTGFADAGNFKVYESMWYPDTTDIDYSSNGIGDAELANLDVLFKAKFNLTTLPTTDINMFWGNLTDNANLYINGHEVSALLSDGASDTINLKNYLRIGENIIGIRTTDSGDGEEGIFVRMTDDATSALGIDLSSTSRSWETRVVDPLVEGFDQIRSFADAWTYEAPRPNRALGAADPSAIDAPTPALLLNNGNGRYTTTATDQGVFKKSVLNTRTVDNYIASTTVTLLESNISAPEDWFGFQLRTNDATDKPEESGYTIKVFQNGTVELHKALLTPPGAATNPTLVATGNIGAVNANTPMDFRIHANGSNIKLYLNNGATPVLNWVDTDANRYTDGSFSFSSQGLYVAYDDFKLSSYAAPIQLLSKALRDGENNIVIKGIAQNAGDMTFTGNIRSVVREFNNTIVANGLKSINMSSSNLPPDLNLLTGGSSKSIMDISYRGSTLAGLQNTELDSTLGYWSVSTLSALGIAGKIDFKNREGGAVQKVKNQFSGVNSLMQNLTSLLGSTDDLFESHLNLIR